MLLLFSCDRKNISSPINETESQLVNKIDFFPESTTYKEITIDGQKVIEAQLPEGFFFRIDGEIAGTLRKFKCECASSGNCYPVLSVGPKSNKPSCLSEGCSACNLILYDNKSSKWDIEIGNIDFIKSMEEIGIKSKGIEGKRIKPITSYTKFRSIPSASYEDFLDTQVQQEIKELEKNFYTDLASKEIIPFPKIDLNTGQIPEGYQAIALELNSKHFIMIVPKDNGFISVDYRTLPHYSVITCTGSCTNATCKFTTAPGSNGSTLFICSGCANACEIKY
jgi:hypothetical protein